MDWILHSRHRCLFCFANAGNSANVFSVIVYCTWKQLSYTANCGKASWRTRHGIDGKFGTNKSFSPKPSNSILLTELIECRQNLILHLQTIWRHLEQHAGIFQQGQVYLQTNSNLKTTKKRIVQIPLLMYIVQSLLSMSKYEYLTPFHR